MQFALFGHPVAHSRSPQIHTAFAAQRQQPMDFRLILAPLDDFAGSVRAFFRDGGTGANVTLPFKEQAWELCDQLSERARQAGAVNTLWQQDGKLHGDNTDGIGMLTDISNNLGWPIKGQRILILGAGGAVRGVLGPLLEQQPEQIRIANRTEEKARELSQMFAGHGIPIFGTGLESGLAQPSKPYDLIINAVSAGLDGSMPALPEHLIDSKTRCYDMIYGDTPFLRWARQQGAAASSDGLGMLVEQAAEAFSIWHGWRPETVPVIEQLR